MKDFHPYINTIYPISDDSFSVVVNEFEEKQVPKKTILCNIGDFPKNIYFIKSGYIRAYTVDSKGKEYTKSLFRAQQFSASFSALIKNEPSKLIYETVTESVLYVGNYSNLRKLARTNIEIANLALGMTEMFYLSIESKLFEFTTKNATQRYLSLLKRFDGIEKLIPQYQIATMLSITPIQLSRIRKSLKNK